MLASWPGQISGLEPHVSRFDTKMSLFGRQDVSICCSCVRMACMSSSSERAGGCGAVHSRITSAARTSTRCGIRPDPGNPMNSYPFPKHVNIERGNTPGGPKCAIFTGGEFRFNGGGAADVIANLRLNASNARYLVRYYFLWYRRYKYSQRTRMISRALQCKGTSSRIPKFNWDLYVSNLNLKHTVPVTRAGPGAWPHTFIRVIMAYPGYFLSQGYTDIPLMA